MLYAVCTPCIVALSCTTSPGAVRFPLPPGATITSTIRRRYWYEPSAAVCYREHWCLSFCCGLETDLTACTARHRLPMLVRPRRCRLVTLSWTAEVTVSASGCCWLLPVAAGWPASDKGSHAARPVPWPRDHAAFPWYFLSAVVGIAPTPGLCSCRCGGW